MSCKKEHTQPSVVSSKEEIAFLDAFLRSQFEPAVVSLHPLVIEEQPSVEMLADGENYARFQEGLMEQWKHKSRSYTEAVKDFCAKNDPSSKPGTICHPTVKHILISRSEMKLLFDKERKKEEKDGWSLFYEKYPHSPGIITLSLPGFSRDGKTAVIYMGNQSHWLAGHGGIYVYQNKNGEWKQETELPEWIS